MWSGYWSFRFGGDASPFKWSAICLPRSMFWCAVQISCFYWYFLSQNEKRLCFFFRISFTSFNTKDQIFNDEVCNLCLHFLVLSILNCLLISLCYFVCFNRTIWYVQDPARACYGPKHVEVAHERLAIQTLLLTDELFRLVFEWQKVPFHLDCFLHFRWTQLSYVHYTFLSYIYITIMLYIVTNNSTQLSFSLLRFAALRCSF